jgi:hypothetical protein
MSRSATLHSDFSVKARNFLNPSFFGKSEKKEGLRKRKDFKCDNPAFGGKSKPRGKQRGRL